MKKNFLHILLVLLMLSPLSLFALTEGSIKADVRVAVDEIQNISKNSALDMEGKRHALDKVIDPIFDFTLMGKLSLGKTAWKALSKEERKEFVKLFTQRTKNAYLSKLDIYKDEKITVLEPKKVKKRIHISTYLILEGERKELLYKLYKSKKDGWKIYDVDVIGVSLVQTNRSQFDAIIKKSSVQGLLEKLREK